MRPVPCRTVKLILFQGANGVQVGRVDQDGVVPLQVPPSVLNEEGALSQLAAAGQEAPQAESELQLAPSVYRPGKIIAVGLNSRRHAQETGSPIPQTPILFSKFNNTLAAACDPVKLPSVASQYDYEVELGVVIGRQAHYVEKERALEYVLGYCTANDLSARDLQFRTSQWLLGKTLDRFCPVGPYLVTRDEVPDPQKLGLRSWLNGELRQNSNTGDMIFSVAEIVSYASRYMTLEPGDLIITGTPEGVILGMPEPRTWLKAGDEVAVEVEGLGRLVTPLVAA